MTKEEALRFALEYVELVPDDRYNAEHIDRDALITAIKAALEAKDEPVGWAEHGVINWLADKQFNHTSFLYATPPQRTWDELTLAEVKEAYNQHAKYQIEDIGVSGWVNFADALQTILRSKNDPH